MLLVDGAEGAPRACSWDIWLVSRLAFWRFSILISAMAFTCLYSHKWCISILLSPYPCQYLSVSGPGYTSCMPAHLSLATRSWTLLQYHFSWPSWLTHPVLWPRYMSLSIWLYPTCTLLNTQTREHFYYIAATTCGWMLLSCPHQMHSKQIKSIWPGLTAKNIQNKSQDSMSTTLSALQKWCSIRIT